ncbi:MAG: AAA family ATPase [Chthonomonadaceae bacterium]|nr:AAA family ATPase [Chthonomonadaceae bacterium]
MVPIWYVELLGEPRAVRGSQVIRHFESRRAVALLAYLSLYQGIMHPREVLADRIWPDADPTVARNRLKQALSSLRRQLEPPDLEPGTVFEADRNHIGLREGATACDVIEYMAAVDRCDFATARRLRRGDLLPGFYDEWLDDFRARLDSKDEEFWDEPDAPQVIQVLANQATHEVKVPLQINTFVGRESEVAHLHEALSLNRLVTVTGMGGVGKTRLIQHFGRQWARGPVWFVPLADLNDPAQIPRAIARSLGIEETGPVESAIKESVSHVDCLLLLDNAEHLVSDGTGKVVTDLLESCDLLRVLVSSRISLGVFGEAELKLRPLPIPEPELGLAELSANPSMRLFVDRARQSRPDFQVTPANCAELADACRRLDGIPLALEMCAAWAHLGVRKMLQMADDQGKGLVSRKHRTDDRHRSLRAILDSALDLLAPSTRLTLGQLSILRGGWALETAQAVTDPSMSDEAVTELIHAVFVNSSIGDENPRYSMLEIVRQYLEESLSESERQASWHRCVSSYMRWARHSAAVLPSPEIRISGQRSWIDFWNREWGNLCAVCRWLAGQDEDGLVQLICNTEWHWSQFRGSPELVDLLKRSTSTRAKLLVASHLTSSEPFVRVEAQFSEIRNSLLPDDELIGECCLRWSKFRILRQEMDGVDELGKEAFAHYSRRAEKSGIGQSLHVLANCAIQRGDDAEAVDSILGSEQAFAETGDEVNLAAVMYTKARHLYMKKDFEGCLAALFECRDLGRSLGNSRFMSRTGNLFGVILRNLGQESLAQVYFYLAANACSRCKDLRGMHMPLWNLFLSLGDQGRWADAVPCMSAAIDIWSKYYGELHEGQEKALLDEFRARAQSELGLVEFMRLEAQGKNLTSDQVMTMLSGLLEGVLQTYESHVFEFTSAKKP